MKTRILILLAGLAGATAAFATEVPKVTINPTQRVQLNLCAMMSDASKSCPAALLGHSPEKFTSSSPAVAVRPVPGADGTIEIDPLQEIFAPGLGAFTTTITARTVDGKGKTVQQIVLRVTIDPAAPREPFTVGVKAGGILVTNEAAQ